MPIFVFDEWCETFVRATNAKLIQKSKLFLIPWSNSRWKFRDWEDYKEKHTGTDQPIEHRRKEKRSRGEAQEKQKHNQKQKRAKEKRRGKEAEAEEKQRKKTQRSSKDAEE